jgi:hypothetical protein
MTMHFTKTADAATAKPIEYTSLLHMLEVSYTMLDDLAHQPLTLAVVAETDDLNRSIDKLERELARQERRAMRNEVLRKAGNCARKLASVRLRSPVTFK